MTNYIGNINPTSKVVGYWKLNGNANDSSASGLNGTGTAVSYSLADGKFGQGCYFQGGNSYITAGNVPITTPPFTIMAWINPDSIDNRTINSGDDGGTAQLRVLNGKLDLVQSQIADIGQSVGTVSTGAWAHVAVTYTSSGAYNFYINGANAGGNGTNLKTFTQRTIVLGSNRGGGQYAESFLGSMCEIVMLNYVMTPEEFRKYYAICTGKYQ